MLCRLFDSGSESDVCFVSLTRLFVQTVSRYGAMVIILMVRSQKAQLDMTCDNNADSWRKRPTFDPALLSFFGNTFRIIRHLDCDMTDGHYQLIF